MRHEIVLMPEAEEDYKQLSARDRATVRDAMKKYLTYEPDKVTKKGRIKRLREMSKPQYRLSVGEIRVFYDVREGVVEVLAIVLKPQAAEWLERWGEK